ncbi:hypothetical protein [Salipaludibacillus sp. CF4.18]|uniref:hypothetical protein n=1 Tax=Salipaludibacillus sp. CF4.18 TaxID=3373081 RepID=UPI003EE470FF
MSEKRVIKTVRPQANQSESKKGLGSSRPVMLGKQRFKDPQVKTEDKKPHLDTLVKQRDKKSNFEEGHKRVTTYFTKKNIETLEKVKVNEKRSITRIVNEAIEQYVNYHYSK